jgi:hypothetical protein
MDDLINWMTVDNPAKRPRIEEVLERFVLIRACLSKGKLRSPITSKKPPKCFGVVQRTWPFFRTIRHVVSRQPAIPDDLDLLYASRAGMS